MEIELEELHLIILIVTAVVILYSDHEGWKYMTGKKEMLSSAFLQRSHILVWSGLVLMILTGILLTLDSWTYRLQEPIFYVKVGFVLILIMNGVAIGTLHRLAATRPFATLDAEEKQTLVVSGMLSGIGWFGAALIGLFFL